MRSIKYFQNKAFLIHLRQTAQSALEFNIYIQTIKQYFPQYIEYDCYPENSCLLIRISCATKTNFHAFINTDQIGTPCSHHLSLPQQFMKHFKKHINHSNFCPFTLSKRIHPVFSMHKLRIKEFHHQKTCEKIYLYSNKNILTLKSFLDDGSNQNIMIRIYAYVTGFCCFLGWWTTIQKLIIEDCQLVHIKTIKNELKLLNARSNRPSTTCYQ